MQPNEIRRQIAQHYAEVRRLKQLLREAGEPPDLSKRILEAAPWATTLEVASIVGCERRYVDRVLRAHGWDTSRHLMVHPTTRRRRWMLVWRSPNEKAPDHR